MQPLTLSTTSTFCLNPSAAGLVRLITLATVALVFLLSLLMLARRFAGALERPLSAAGLVATALALALFAYAVRRSYLGLLRQHMEGVEAHAVMWLPLVSLLGFGSALSLPGSNVTAVTTFWMILSAEEVSWIWYQYRYTFRQQLTGPAQPPLSESAAFDATASQAVDTPARLGRDDPNAASPFWQAPTPLDSLPGDVLQQLTRCQDEQGGENIRGLLRARFAPGQRSLSLHVAFCPPLETVPECTLSQRQGPAVQVDAGQVMPYGVRIDLRRPKQNLASEDVLIELYARSR